MKAHVTIPLAYFLFGIMWIVATDALVESLAPSMPALTLFQTAKGWLYVVMSSLLLYGLLGMNHRRRLEQEAERAALQRQAENDLRRLNTELDERVRARTTDLEAAREREVKIGFRIQQMLLLTPPPANVPGLEIAALTIPSQRIDGDFYDFFEHQRRLDVIVADVMGKGLPAALVAAATKSNFLEALCRLTARSGGMLPEPKEIVTLAHADMVRKLIELESFVTLSYARFDLDRRRLELVDCGHTGMMVVRGASGEGEILHGQNLPLGIREGEIFDQLTLAFEPGDLFVFYSDGITDNRNHAGEFYGTERLADFVKRNRGLSPHALVTAIRADAVAFAQTDQFTDDLTCVVVRASDEPRATASSSIELRSELAQLGRAREFVREFCRTRAGMTSDPDTIASLELAVNEALSNVMKHAYRGRADQWIQLEAQAYPDRVTITLHHGGEAFAPDDAREPAFDGSRESGFGLYLMSRTVDEIRYSRDDRGQSCVTLVKILGTKRSPA